ncbi:S9 family peptidase [Bacillus swezeyi]|uniref:Peptidase n=1 Tax=Bacillus swezeyi TaxID=1925020 RepID=A0A1R1RSN2_9BACI|nr:S9 family peptidase [Bacillus swezeyi]MEC1262134.1 S9 family peptidase [Bacillus swezeyi]MED2927298.1 S9 family peptidase [Bacillus swezeyi]MED2941551.1 S9 family peptidase [Bacillus swezeyi]MED2962496.1 S9 family peptidase [Bacillus swezeyi]MED3072049.1 S9 family peptidase [Bacillus swezeyi]
MKQLITESDLTKLVSITDPQYSPDGGKVAYVQTNVNQKQDSYDAHIMVFDFEKKESAQWTFGKGRNQHPRWSPDGSMLAFTSNRDETTQVYVMNTAGGEARKVTDIPYDVSQPEWSPDGRSLLCSVKLTKDESPADKEKTKLEEHEPLEVDSLVYKADGQGFKRGKYTQLILVDLETEEIKQVTDQERDHLSHAFSPCGKMIAFSANLTGKADARVNDVYLMTLSTGETKRLTGKNGIFSSLSFSPDGKYLAFLGNEKEFQNATLDKAWLYDIEKGKVSCLTEMLDVHLSDAVAGDSLVGGVLPKPAWTKDGNGFYVIGTDQGSTGIYYISTEGLAYPVRLEKEHLNGFSLRPDETGFAAAIALPVWPSELYYIPLGEEKADRLTHANQAFTKERIISEPEEIQFETKDGLIAHGWLIKPAQYEEGKTYPLILEVHGGPHAMYANAYFHEFQVLAAHGNTVVYVNPRGSHGYGQDFVNRVRGDYGGGDFDDVMAAVDHVLGRYDFIDQERLGITGGSYGGFMTNWAVGHTNRFKAAVTQRSISNWISFYGVSDIGYFFTEWQLGLDLFENPDKLWDRSPLKYADRVETPLLILHGERDDRCPVEQAEQLFTALKKMGKEVKLVRFPHASHDLSRNGHPTQRIKRLEYIGGWFDKYL